MFSLLKTLDIKDINLDKNWIKNICFYARIEIAPIVSILAAIIVFETIKYTGKFLPMKEFFYLDFMDCLPETRPEEVIDPKHPFFDQLTLFGSAIHKKLS